MRIVYTPNPTGSGHNMRTLAIAQQVHRNHPGIDQVVLLGSMQETFSALFTNAGVDVIDLDPSRNVDTSRTSHLTRELNWAGMVAGYLVPAFLNGERMLRYLAAYQQLGADLVVSDYNPNASLAAALGGVRHALVTERFNFSLVNVSDTDLARGGGAVDEKDLADARTALNQVFTFITGSSVLVLTDKPVLPNNPADDEFRELLANGKAYFTGPMIRALPEPAPGRDPRAELGLGSGPLLVATVGGTTMRMENKRGLVDAYLDAHALLRRDRPDLELVLIGRGESAARPGVHNFTYLPEWMPLIRSASALLVPPGWISVTEICAMGIPAVFTLSSYDEYHEIEPIHRLADLGFVTNIGTDPEVLAKLTAPLLDDPAAVMELRERYRVVAPHADGARRAAELLAGVL